MSTDSPDPLKETPAQRAMVEVAMQRMADYKQRWLPMQKALGGQVEAMGAADSFERRRGAGMVAADTDAAFGKAAKAAQVAGIARRDVGSSSNKLEIAGLEEDRATSKALGLAGVDEQIDNAYLQGLSQIMAVGQGQRANAIEGMSGVAAMSGRQAAVDAQQSLESRLGTADFAGQVVGMAAGMKGRGGAPGSNDLPAVGSGNAMDQFMRLGRSGD